MYYNNVWNIKESVREGISMANIPDIFKLLGPEAKKIFHLIQKKGPLTKNTLLHITGMKLSTLNRTMLPLEENNLIIEAGVEESSGGRKPVLYDVNPGTYYSVGIDISRTYTRVITSNLKMNILGMRQFPMNEKCSPTETVKLISEAVTAILAQLNIQESQLLGAGLGTVGPLDREKGIMINPLHFPAEGWDHTPIKRLLEEKLELPVVIDNGANVAVLAEHFFGDGRNYSNLAYFNCGIGIRTGAIASGRIIRTINDAEDAFGHMVVDVDGERCSCGNFGCIECYSSIIQITRKFVSELKKGRTSSISKPVEDIIYLDICRAAEEDDALAREIITGAATIFGTGLANYINLLNPGLIILSGPLVKNSKLFYDISSELALKKHYLRENNRVIFKRSGCFGDNAMAVGSAAMVIEELVNQ